MSRQAQPPPPSEDAPAADAPSVGAQPCEARRQRRGMWIAGVVIVVAAALGVTLAATDAPWATRLHEWIWAVALLLGSIRVALVAVLTWRSSRRLLALLYWVFAVLVGLLALPAWHRVLEGT